MSRSRRQDGIVATTPRPPGPRRPAARHPRRRRSGRPGRRSGDDPGPGQHAALARPRRGRARAAGRPGAGRNATPRSAGSSGCCPPARRRPSRRPTAHEPRTAVRPDPGEVERLSLLEPEARLRPQTVALAGPADADRVEDRRLDDHVRVSGPISDATPPMIPAIAIGPLGSAITRVSSVSVRSTWSSVSSRSPAAARRTTIRPVVDGRRVERVDRLAELEHDVVLASTTLLTGRIPAASNRPGRAGGTGRSGRRRPTAPTNRGQRSGSTTSTASCRSTGGPVSVTSSDGRRTGAPVTIEISRASPTIDSASPRFGLTSISRTTSPYRSARGLPIGVSAAG